MFSDEKGFVLKIVPNMERRDEDKPSNSSKYYIKVLSKSLKCIIKASVCDKVKVNYNLRVA
jgi:hypothetical protein